MSHRRDSGRWFWTLRLKSWNSKDCRTIRSTESLWDRAESLISIFPGVRGRWGICDHGYLWSWVFSTLLKWCSSFVFRLYRKGLGSFVSSAVSPDQMLSPDSGKSSSKLSRGIQLWHLNVSCGKEKCSKIQDPERLLGELMVWCERISWTPVCTECNVTWHTRSFWFCWARSDLDLELKFWLFQEPFHKSSALKENELPSISHRNTFCCKENQLGPACEWQTRQNTKSVVVELQILSLAQESRTKQRVGSCPLSM